MAIGWTLQDLALANPTTAFGDLRIAAPNARAQIDAVYGLVETDIITAARLSGTTTSTGALFTCATGTTAGASAEIRSRRFVRYRPGEGVLVRCTANFTPGVVDSTQLAGAFNACDGIGFGYVDEAFGIFRRLAGAVSIQRLTVTAGASGVETLTITLDGVAFVLPATGGALSTTATAAFIAAQANAYTGWRVFRAQAVGAAVTFFQDSPAPTPGVFLLTNTGTATGVFAAVQAGEANTLTEASGAFVPRTEWNIDRLDGSRNARNPSGLLLDPTQLNVYEVVLPYLGAGAIEYRVMTPRRKIIPVHVIEYPGQYQVPNMKNPSLWLGWRVESLGSTTNLVVEGASAAGFVEGEVHGLRDPFALSATVTAQMTEYVALAIRVRGEFGGTVNLREIFPHTLTSANDSNNRTITVRCRLNSTLTGSFAWVRLNASTSAADYVLAPTTVTTSGGREVLALALAGANSGAANLAEHDIRLGPGDVLVVTTQTNTLTAVTNVALSWHEI